MRQQYLISYVSESWVSQELVLATMRDAAELRARRLGAEDLFVTLAGGSGPEHFAGAAAGWLAIEMDHDELDRSLGQCLYAETLHALKDIGVHAAGIQIS